MLSGFFPTSGHSISVSFFISSCDLQIMDFLQAWGLALFPRRTSSIPGLIHMSLSWARPLHCGAAYLLDTFIWTPPRYLKVGTSLQGSVAPCMVQLYIPLCKLVTWGSTFVLIFYHRVLFYSLNTPRMGSLEPLHMFRTTILT